ncbi:hypothetical protein PJV94_07765 [Aliarcobacter butzleri]|uniref:hypothetical protein n=1 Tax=Aliarcobacter butzleri TaxID=28197 RepID=UPI00263E1567|nr:hypothetical protein [Aliarcobacter butzleri]MDN5072327.1 hypothetical protein [Aliarcobacter butzleri]MDN5121563.1 hypothetical protein [Aliarcobacter butzleri]
MSEQNTFTQTGINSTQIQNQYNNYSLNTFNYPPKEFPKNGIQTRFIFHSLREKITFSVFLIIPILIVAIAILKLDANYLKWSMLYIVFFIIYFIFLVYFSIKKYKAILKIENDKLILNSIKDESKNKEIQLKDIHSFLKEKDLLGYQFFIYAKDEINPKFGFAFFSIHETIAVEELLKYQINEVIKKENSKKEHQTN